MLKLVSSLIIFLNVLFISNNSIAAQKIQIIYKINNSLITNIDINDEFNYLISLNSKLNNLDKNEVIEIAKESLIREKIKLNEIKKFFIIEKYENDLVIQGILKNIYTNLDLNSLPDFENYLNTFEFDQTNRKSH